MDKKNGLITGEIEYMTADIEDEYIVAQATEPVDEAGCLVNTRVTCRHRNEIIEVDSLETAVLEAHARAVAGDVVMMSPASASFDRFQNFMERGDLFKALVQGL